MGIPETLNLCDLADQMIPLNFQAETPNLKLVGWQIDSNC
jgi:hypothetical protein